MDYYKVNTVDIDGDGNIMLQDVTGQNITVNYNDTKEFGKLLSLANDEILSEIKELMASRENSNTLFTDMLGKYFGLSPEIKEFKKLLQKQITELFAKIAASNSIQKNDDENTNQRPSRKNRSLLRALEEEKCILFVGPEISVNSEGNSLHEAFYKSLTDDPESNLEYNKSEGFFQPHADPWFKSDIQNYYENEFAAENKEGEKVLKILAQLPFKLMVSMSPDDTMHQILKKYDKAHEYLFYDKTKISEVKFSVEKPLVFNMLGSPVFCESDWQYIFTYNDFYDYLKTAEMTGNMKNEIKNAVHYLFIGFDFNKWHNRMLLYVLDIIKDKESKIRHLVEPNMPDDFSKNFLQKQFNISYIEQDYLKFVNEIAESAKVQGIFSNFEQEFAEKQTISLNKIDNKLFDADKMTVLKEIEEEIKQLSQKF